jgi:hypothetical protein
VPPPFSFKARQSQASEEFTKLVAERLNAVREQFIASSNVMSFSHGSGWKSDYPTALDNEGSFQAHSSEIGIKFDEVISHDVSVIRRNIEHIVRELSDQFQRSLFTMVSETTEKSGNTVSAKNYQSNIEAVLATLEKIEFGVDVNGQVSLPTIYMGGEGSVEKMIGELKAAGPEFEARFETVKKHKIEKALAGEQERKSKFVKRDDLT